MIWNGNHLTFDEVIGTSVTASESLLTLMGYTAATAARGTDTKNWFVGGAKAIDQDDAVTLSYSGTNLADSAEILCILEGNHC